MGLRDCEIWSSQPIYTLWQQEKINRKGQRLFEEIIARKNPNLREYMSLQIQEAQ